ncbi:MAG: serine hydrolase domain-containing protein [Longimicrobiales bacterium]
MSHCSARSSWLLAVTIQLAFVAPPQPLAGQERSLGERLREAEQALATHQDTSGVVGLSAAIAVDGRLVWSGGFGYANLQHRVEAGSQMVSRVGSVSKPIAGAAAMALWDQGRLDLDVPISTYLPDYPAANARITTRQLMSHTAGVRHYMGDEFMSNRRYNDVFAPMEIFAADTLLFEPGSEYSYSTYGWTVVSAVTDAADQRDWIAILDDEVIEPLGLTTLQPEWQDSVIPHLASYYVRDDETGTVTNAKEVNNSNKWAGGGLVSTAADIVKFALGVADGSILSDRARAEMWRRQTPADEPSYGLGWNVSEIDGRRVVSHSGGSMGATAMLVLLPDDGVAVAVLGNTGGVGHAAIARRVARLFLD